MKDRKHHNNKGARSTRRGSHTGDLVSLAQKLGVKMECDFYDMKKAVNKLASDLNSNQYKKTLKHWKKNGEKRRK